MGKFQNTDNVCYEWPCRPGLKKEKLRSNSQAKNPEGSEKKESPEGMIRSLKGVFCKGRYHSWVFSQGK